MGKELKVFRLSCFIVPAVLMLAACKPNDFSKIPAYSSSNHLQAVIENPAGTNMKVFYCRMTHRFKLKMEEGKEEKLEYLPYPANFGFIPSSNFESPAEEKGGLLEVLVLAKQYQVGDLVEIRPLGMLIIRDQFETVYKIVSVPVDTAMQTIHASSLLELETNYKDIPGLLESWFLNSGLYSDPVILGWEDEHVAGRFIDKWIVRR